MFQPLCSKIVRHLGFNQDTKPLPLSSSVTRCLGSSCVLICCSGDSCSGFVVLRHSAWGRGGLCEAVGPWASAPLELWAQILPRQPPGQLLCREAVSGVGRCLCEKIKRRFWKVSLNAPSQRSGLSLWQPVRGTDLILLKSLIGVGVECGMVGQKVFIFFFF